jgi:hypothetical protein
MPRGRRCLFHHSPPDQGVSMSKPVLITIGVIVALLGLLFTLQGLWVVGGSAMSGSTLWAVLGPIIAIVGIVLVVLGLRKRPTP